MRDRSSDELFMNVSSVIIPFRCYSASTTNHVLDTTENCLESLETNRFVRSLDRGCSSVRRLSYCLDLPAQPDEGSPRSSRLLQAALTWSETHTRAEYGLHTTLYITTWAWDYNNNQHEAKVVAPREQTKERAKLPLILRRSFCT